MKFKYVRTLSISDIPSPTRPARRSCVQKTTEWDEVVGFLKNLPSEGIGVNQAIELPSARIIEKISKEVKDPIGTLKQHLRSCLKELKLESKVRIISRDSGRRIFLADAKARIE
jgi:hypothetical protein